jgi:hypothetical protein
VENRLLYQYENVHKQLEIYPMSSITVGLCGGIGNQLFQYAMGLTLALRNNVSLKLDTSSFKIDKYYRRTYELNRLNIRFKNEIVSMPTTFRAAQRLQYLPHFRPFFQSLCRPWCIIEKSSDFDEYFLKLKINKSAYLMGFWQDERYFDDIKDVIVNEFTLHDDLSENNAIIARHISETNSIAVHVRRLHHVQSSHAALPQEKGEETGIALRTNYYERAINEILARDKNLHFVIFSDYPEWAKTHLRLPSPGTFLDNNRGPDIEDLTLMAMCKHHIIANSSFSWWGAYLGFSEKQIVIAPTEASLMPNIPKRWITI